MPKKATRPKTTSVRRLSIQELDRRGWAWVELERRGKFGRTYDIWGCDFLAVTPEATHLIQATSDSNHAARRRKLLAIPDLLCWVDSPNRMLMVWSWGTRNRMGSLREETLTPADFNLRAD